MIINNSKYIKIITLLLRHSNPTEKFIKSLSNSGFLSNYIKNIINLNHLKYFNYAISLFDCFGRICFIKDYLEFSILLINLVNNYPPEKNILTIIIILSQYKECLNYFKENNLINYFKNLKKIEKFNEFSNLFFYYVKN